MTMMKKHVSELGKLRLMKEVSNTEGQSKYILQFDCYRTRDIDYKEYPIEQYDVALKEYNQYLANM